LNATVRQKNNLIQPHAPAKTADFVNGAQRRNNVRLLSTAPPGQYEPERKKPGRWMPGKGSFSSFGQPTLIVIPDETMWAPVTSSC
jgi:hypothetical protein